MNYDLLTHNINIVMWTEFTDSRACSERLMSLQVYPKEVKNRYQGSPSRKRLNSAGVMRQRRTLYTQEKNTVSTEMPPSMQKKFNTVIAKINGQ